MKMLFHPERALWRLTLTRDKAQVLKAMGVKHFVRDMMRYRDIGKDCLLD